MSFSESRMGTHTPADGADGAGTPESPRPRMVSRRGAVAGMGALAAAIALPSLAAMTGCASDGSTTSIAPTADGSAAMSAPSISADLDAPDISASTSGDRSSSAAAGSLGEVRLGTMATEDFLPGWVAERDGLFDQAGVTCTVTAFQSAQELSTAVAAGEIDMAMTDPMVSAALSAAGTDVRMPWVTLGATPEQGRFGIATAKSSGLTSVDDLRGATIGVGSNTLPEYVMDKLLEAAGIGEGDFTPEEVKKVPVRFQEMESGQVDAAALPASLLALGEATDCVTLVDDSTGDNLSQSVMIVRSEFADAAGGSDLVDAVRQAWNAGADAINADPESYRDLLVEKAGLSDAVADSYPISTYPTDVAPTSDMIQPILDWMSEKGYLETPLTFDADTCGFGA
ncbi:MAG: ABC transporter substrate-binding protein [Coriobacteriales bacterium]